MENEVKILTGLAGLVLLYNIKPITKAVANGMKNYLRNVQEAYKGCSVEFCRGYCVPPNLMGNLEHLPQEQLNTHRSDIHYQNNNVFSRNKHYRTFN